jgi:hypothetical protein
LPATIALGFMASFSPDLARSALECGGVAALKDAILEDPEDHLKAAAVWALGQVGRHSATHARAVAEADTLRHVLSLHLTETGSEDLREKAKRALTGEPGARGRAWEEGGHGERAA